jgi:pleiotropic regulator 1
MKSVRALTQPSFEHTFVSGAPDCLKKWQGKDGRFLKSYRGHKAVVNALAVNDDGVLVSGGDDGSLQFRDYETGYCFQSTSTIAQPRLLGGREWNFRFRVRSNGNSANNL